MTAPLLPVEAENISYTFAGCASLGGVVYLPALPTSYTSCFAGTRAIIRVMGCVDSATSEAIAATAEEGNVCFYPSQYTGSNLINQSTTGTVVESVSEGGFTTSYTYDANGNILSITRTNDATNEVVESRYYRYDGKNQLIFEGESETVGTTYTYDNNGNILSKTAPDGTVTHYAYTDPTWGDLLTSFNGEAISYDAIGNPLNWRGGATLTWKDGRKLSTYTKAGQTYTYLYDGEGYRVGKTIGNTVYEYTVIDGIIYAETRTTGTSVTTLHYLFDDSGLRIGFVLNGTTTYYYRFNLQGDVTGIYDANGNLIAEYTYDAWGNPLTVTGSDLTVANLNPIRYRGYYYDGETGFYATGARYYDSVVCRFISPEPNVYAGAFDGVAGILAYNVYAYCANNPAIFKDYSGESIVLVVAGITLTAKGVAALIGFGFAASFTLAYANEPEFRQGVNDLIVTGINKTSNLLQPASKTETTYSVNPAVSQQLKALHIESIPQTLFTDKYKLLDELIPRPYCSYWLAFVLKESDCVVKTLPLTYSEARAAVAAGQSIVCRDRGAAYAIAKFYPNAVHEYGHKEGYLNHYHLNKHAHGKKQPNGVHIWYYGA